MAECVIDQRTVIIARIIAVRQQEQQMWLVDKPLRDAHDERFKPQCAAILVVRHELVDIEVDLLMKRAVGSDEKVRSCCAAIQAGRHEGVNLGGDLMMKRGVHMDGYTVKRMQELKDLDVKLKKEFDAEIRRGRLQIVDMGGDVQMTRGVQIDAYNGVKAANARMKELKARNTKLYEEFLRDKKPGDDAVRERNIVRGHISHEADRLEVTLGIGPLNENVLNDENVDQGQDQDQAHAHSSDL